MTHKEKQRMRQLTMGCWWPSRAYPLMAPNWDGIAKELCAIVVEEEIYFGERGSDLARLHEFRALRQLAKDKANLDKT